MEFLTAMGKETVLLRGEKESEWFAEAMLRTLNLPKNVAKGDWRTKDWEALYGGLNDEVYELFEACMNLKLGLGDEAKLKKRIIEEATDVALYAMMLADKLSKD
jgi:hypothetical protein